MSYLARWQSLILPAAIIACVVVLITPLPAGLLDVLLAANIAIAIIVLLTTLHVKTPLEFSIFPSLLLATTLSRLVLNVASTRLILSQAPTERLDAAGQVIRAFGESVTLNHVVVGLVIFSIIVVIQFVVITKGATRISEVAARFTLDSLPGRQMAIDADLNAGLIDKTEAHRQREQLKQEFHFYGAMDGASKFVRGDAVAGIIITLINIVCGFAIGVLDAGMTLAESGSVFTKLTVGDGLVSQTPAMLISLAAGLLVSRSSQPVDLPVEFLRQLFSRPQVLAVAACFLGLLMFTNLPTLPLLMIGAGCAGLAYVLSRAANRESQHAERNTADQADKREAPEKRIEDFLAVDPMEIEIGVGLIRLADPNRGGDLLAQITDVRRRVAAELGIVLPKVRVRDNMQLGRRDYRLKIAGNAVAQGSVLPDRLMAIQGDAPFDGLSGQRTRDPASGRSAVWIDIDDVQQAKRHGCAIVEPTAALAAHLRETVRDHAADLLTRDATKQLIDETKKRSPAVVDELIPSVMRLGEVQQVLQRLLREGVPVRQLAAILEALGDHAPSIGDPIELTECVRQRLGRTICARYRDDQHCLRVVTIDPELEDRVLAGIQHGERGLSIRLSPQTVQNLCEMISREIEELVQAGHPPIVLVSPEIRVALKQITVATLPRLIVLSYDEITADTVVESFRIVSEATPVAA